MWKIECNDAQLPDLDFTLTGMTSEKDLLAISDAVKRCWLDREDVNCFVILSKLFNWDKQAAFLYYKRLSHRNWTRGKAFCEFMCNFSSSYLDQVNAIDLIQAKFLKNLEKYIWLGKFF